MCCSFSMLLGSLPISGVVNLICVCCAPGIKLFMFILLWVYGNYSSLGFQLLKQTNEEKIIN